jgi:hypothetical protein
MIRYYLYVTHGHWDYYSADIVGPFTADGLEIFKDLIKDKGHKDEWNDSIKIKGELFGVYTGVICSPFELLNWDRYDKFKDEFAAATTALNSLGFDIPQWLIDEYESNQ